MLINVSGNMIIYFSVKTLRVVEPGRAGRESPAAESTSGDYHDLGQNFRHYKTKPPSTADLRY